MLNVLLFVSSTLHYHCHTGDYGNSYFEQEAGGSVEEQWWLPGY